MRRTEVRLHLSPQTLEANTKPTPQKLPRSVATLVHRTPGCAARVAQAAGLSESYVSMVLAGHKPPSLKFLRALVSVILSEGDTLLRTNATGELVIFLGEFERRERGR